MEKRCSFIKVSFCNYFRVTYFLDDWVISKIQKITEALKYIKTILVKYCFQNEARDSESKIKLKSKKMNSQNRSTVKSELGLVSQEFCGLRVVITTK